MILVSLSIIALVMASFALAPIVQKLGTNADENISYKYDNGTIVTCADKNQENFTTSQHPEIIRGACVARDRTFDAFLVLPMFAIIAIVAWGFLSAVRRDYGQFEG